MGLYLLLLILTLVDQWFFKSVFHEELIIFLLVVALFRFIKSMTNRIGIAEIVSLAGCIIYVVMPLAAYTYFDKKNYLARLYETTMQIDQTVYFSFALPGTILLLLGLQLTLVRQKTSERSLIESCKTFLADKTYIGYLLIALGVIGSMAINYVPGVFSAILYFQSQLTFIGFLYLLHSKLPGKPLLIFIAIAILIGQSAMTGMYGELVFWSALGAIILILNKRISFFMRTAFIFIGALGILLIQSVKHEYRLAMWSGPDQGSKPAVMLTLIKSRITHPETLFEPLRIYGIVTRSNQGFLVARTLKYVPKHEPFAKGETIITSVAAAIVPRFLWKDKPEIGGREMVCRFLGDCGRLRYSYDIGQLGEGYVNFGKAGGAIFMFFYGMLIRTLFAITSNISIRYPTLILWVPLFFFSALSLETDFLTFLNSFIKSVLFCIVVFGSFRWLLGRKL